MFAGSISLEAAEQVCGEPPLVPTEVAGLLADLVDRSMVVVERGEAGTRYRLLDTLRDYGARGWPAAARRRRPGVRTQPTT